MIDSDVVYQLMGTTFPASKFRSPCSWRKASVSRSRLYIKGFPMVSCSLKYARLKMPSKQSTLVLKESMTWGLLKSASVRLNLARGDIPDQRER
ncbi:hypothetical protein FOPG_20226 [Fusarium oxysporum f. sp. conglutinans race 2 54008]|uniref:Uncharacterized protein n=1 Tax=Fusarium oxysporum f. sp. conglutinans race 2 54008 TaxID=1089457 RepID=X0GUA9_FUSOX|nr:hypothetical protein FOPG_20226 [Fusarium oxysporum f. sp. conglutinans race 2 54008]